MNDPTRYIPAVVDRRTGLHQLLSIGSVPHNEAIRLFQALGPNAVESPLTRVAFIAHVGDGESWWDSRRGGPT